MKIYLTYGTEDREGLETVGIAALANLPNDSVDEIQGNNVLEKVPHLAYFIDECYRVLKPEAKAIFSSPFYLSRNAWASPLTIRALSEYSLNFSDKAWGEQNKFTELTVHSNFEVQGSFALTQEIMTRSEEARLFWTQKYANVAEAIMFTLIKRPYE
jgi:ubiquinone/menaquinone biosynthesis C-methylase UbiE